MSPRGYCDRSFLGGCDPTLDRCNADSDECCDGGSNEEVFDLELGSDTRSESAIGGCGDLGGFDICDGDLEDGNEERDVRRGPGGREPLCWPLLLWIRDMYGNSTMVTQDSVNHSTTADFRRERPLVSSRRIPQAVARNARPAICRDRDGDEGVWAVIGADVGEIIQLPVEDR